MAQGVHTVQVVAERAKACWVCKRVRFICFDDLNIVSHLMALLSSKRIIAKLLL